MKVILHFFIQKIEENFMLKKPFFLYFLGKGA